MHATSSDHVKIKSDLNGNDYRSIVKQFPDIAFQLKCEISACPKMRLRGKGSKHASTERKRLF